jgi:hypothetical protein
MAPLIVMLAAWLVARLAGTAGLWLQADSWTGALRIALAAMFVFTAVSHFHPRTRPDLIRMVPTSLPAPTLLVSATGVFEPRVARVRQQNWCRCWGRTRSTKDCRSTHPNTRKVDHAAVT